jgi:hypothetical protein
MTKVSKEEPKSDTKPVATANPDARNERPWREDSHEYAE